MHTELRRCNTIGDSQGIYHFLDVVLSDEPIERDSARQICSFIDNIRLDFNSALLFFENLNLLKLEGNKIVSTRLGKALKAKFPKLPIEDLCSLCFKKVIEKGYIKSDSIRFNVQLDAYVIQKHAFSMSAAVFRNFLLQLKALNELPNGSLLITLNNVLLFVKIQERLRRKMTLAQLKDKLIAQEEQGKKAEEFVLNFERKRLNGSLFIEKIKRISDIDVSAGYDIVSFQDDKSKNYDRFIEVKSFKGKPHFYWSKNEMTVAKSYGENYFIYLVDIDQISKLNYVPQIICNPDKTIVNSDDWFLTPESYKVVLLD